ncbi:hypothetical protein CupriaWKF_09990 [Cupriavidus sp. WKF15]|uniref:hypothetical protein n=1 Tax=Cupriavidus sp. WKF15 TaxID=3032282 RepID=UPI0023E1FDD9|nr:hypothetical protein [Cupriavidus sp. WKF15]WER44676.1 hypothetical protein CupriaWKF_09990 [Cupriavidus sp. WKF15]
MYIHVAAFEAARDSIRTGAPGPKWGYMMAIRYTVDRDDRMFCESFDEEDDYYTRTAAEQAAVHYGKLAVDIIHGLA